MKYGIFLGAFLLVCVFNLISGSTIYVAHKNQVAPGASSFIKGTVNGASFTWGTDATVPQSLVNYVPSLVAYTSNEIFAFTDGTNTPSHLWELAYTISTNTWAPAKTQIAISHEINYSPGGAYFIDALWVFYVVTTDNSIWYTSSTNGGASWGVEAKIGGSNSATSPVTAVYGTSDLFVFWGDAVTGGISWSVYNGAGWTSVQSVPGATTGLPPGVARIANEIFVFYNLNLELWYTVYNLNTGVWTTPSQITSISSPLGGQSGPTTVVDSSNNLINLYTHAPNLYYVSITTSGAFVAAGQVPGAVSDNTPNAVIY